MDDREPSRDKVTDLSQVGDKSGELKHTKV